MQQRKHTADWIQRHRLVVDESVRPDLEAAVKRQASFGHMFLRLCYQDRTYLEQVRLRIVGTLLVPLAALLSMRLRMPTAVLSVS
jgi:hypothetical protein